MRIAIGNLFESGVQTLVNTVNCVGVMGKGIAKEFRKRYPRMYEEYASLCEEGLVTPGIPYHYTDLQGTSILNFPTKDHWRSPSKLSYITSGLMWFREHYEKLGITSIAFPPLGCGNGGLPWDVVGPIMYDMLKDLPINIVIYAPYGTPATQLTESFLQNSVPHSQKELLGRDGLQVERTWLLILDVVRRLNNNQYSLNVGRTIFQKICYVLTRTGVSTGFQFQKAYYGPYSERVQYAIRALTNSNYMSERRLGKMVETVINPQFVFPAERFTAQEMDCAERTFDLFSRVKDTEQAEMIATILFSFDQLAETAQPTELQVLSYVMEWKPHWQQDRAQRIRATICELSSTGWIHPRQDRDLLEADDDLF